jgi:hypothetical protein
MSSEPRHFPPIADEALAANHYSLVIGRWEPYHPGAEGGDGVSVIDEEQGATPSVA